MGKLYYQIISAKQFVGPAQITAVLVAINLFDTLEEAQQDARTKCGEKFDARHYDTHTSAAFVIESELLLKDERVQKWLEAEKAEGWRDCESQAEINKDIYGEGG